MRSIHNQAHNPSFRENNSFPLRHPARATGKPRRILFVTSEHADLVKVGGLGEVSAALPKALANRHQVRLLIPGYRQVLQSGHPIQVVGSLPSYAGIPACHIGLMHLRNGLAVYVVLCPELYERDGNPYADVNGEDWPDNPVRFARLGLAAADIARGHGLAQNGTPEWQPELVHAQDWPSGLALAYMKWQGQTTPSVFTIHNLAHQGLCDPAFVGRLGLPPEAMGLDAMEFYGKLSFIKAGIVYASHVTTVSNTYAREITQPEFGCGLDGLLKLKFEQHQLSGITNGIDESWEPGSDPHLVESFGLQQWHGKRANTRYLENLFNLHHGQGPMFAVVSRLAHQKGLDLTLAIAETIMRAGGRLVVMGTGEVRLEQALLRLAKRHPHQVGVHIGFNEADARRIFAGSDFYLMPSRFEPCGLSQMYAQSFGSLPIAHRTGGLADTIEDGLSGFLFNSATVESYRHAVQRALYVYRHPNLLNAMRCRAMASPAYWQESVQPYDRLYRRLLGEPLGKIDHQTRHDLQHEWRR
jgi:starch synthase